MSAEQIELVFKLVDKVIGCHIDSTNLALHKQKSKGNFMDLEVLELSAKRLALAEVRAELSDIKERLYK